MSGVNNDSERFDSPKVYGARRNQQQIQSNKNVGHYQHKGFLVRNIQLLVVNQTDPGEETRFKAKEQDLDDFVFSDDETKNDKKPKIIVIEDHKLTI
ncbi:MAG: hypothetical protein EZS28_028233 [Streblomastix strix]|uniref:Uncharacterized protein n=1 Tax=Streblomastix strix TaxID=222440 RepID=A0A5J4V1I4_9EUKA|nr:MAG: hypothetical protein EZS28_028233 [Streblomastix strix]